MQSCSSKFALLTVNSYFELRIHTLNCEFMLDCEFVCISCYRHHDRLSNLSFFCLRLYRAFVVVVNIIITLIQLLYVLLLLLLLSLFIFSRCQ